MTIDSDPSICRLNWKRKVNCDYESYKHRCSPSQPTSTLRDQHISRILRRAKIHRHCKVGPWSLRPTPNQFGRLIGCLQRGSPGTASNHCRRQHCFDAQLRGCSCTRFDIQGTVKDDRKLKNSKYRS